MAAKVQVKKTPDGRFQFLVLGTRGQVLATGEPYSTKASCLSGLAALRRAAADAEVEDQTNVAAGTPTTAPAPEAAATPVLAPAKPKKRHKKAKAKKTGPGKRSKK